jgi:hypothetical protein
VLARRTDYNWPFLLFKRARRSRSHWWSRLLCTVIVSTSPNMSVAMNFNCIAFG